MTDEAETRKLSARRRLIGAVVLALVTVVALPMIFDKEPPPLTDVEIIIPSRDTPGTLVLLEGGAGMQTGSATTPATTALPAPIPSPTLGSPAVTPAPSTPTSAPAPVQKPVAAVAGTPATKIDLPKANPPAANGYFLQLGVFSSEAGAHKLAKRVADAGFTVHVVEDAGRYKVRCGPVSAKPAAQDLQTRLRGKGFTTVLVNP